MLWVPPAPAIIIPKPADIVRPGDPRFLVGAMLPGLAGLGGKGAAAGGGGPAFWDPTALSTALRAWYQADIISGSNGDPQGSITDSSGNAFTLTQTGGNRATLAAADLNSLNTLRFTAANSQRYPLSASIMNGLSEGSVHFVYKLVSATANTGFLNMGTSGSDNHWPFSDGNIYTDFGSTVRKSCGTPTGSLASYRIISVYSAAGAWSLYVDGGTGGSGGGTSPLSSTGTNTVAWPGAGIQLGANAGLSNFLDGWLPEIFFSSATNPTTDGRKAQGYLAYKWGLQGNLAATHPYKSTRPTV